MKKPEKEVLGENDIIVEIPLEPELKQWIKVIKPTRASKLLERME